MTLPITDDPPATEHAAQPVPATPPEPPLAFAVVERPSRRHLWVLLGICVLAGVLRFSFMGRPELWGDDAYTIYRTHADYQSMLDVLQYDGFTPLHYELYWLLGRVTGTTPGVHPVTGEPVLYSTGLTPRAVRFLPALFGTLMVPGMYFLASQLVRRRTALVVALFAACSAYLLGYSRDGKMYMMQWCFSAWSAATLLWWFRTGSRVSYLAWVASSLFMASSHMTGMALLPLEALFFLTRRKVHWRESILFVIGLAIAVLPPAGYITQFNRWAQEAVEDIGFEVEGLNWVRSYNAGRTGPELALSAVTAYLFSWESPNPRLHPRTPAWVTTTFPALMAIFLVLMAVGAMPWSRRMRGLGEEPVGLLSLQEAGRRLEDEAPEPWWRVALWLGAWIAVPAYFVYCRSMVDFSSPRDWWDATAAYLAGTGWRTDDGRVGGWFWALLVLVGAGVGVAAFRSARFRQAVVWGVPLVAGAALLGSAIRGSATPAGPDEPGWVLWAAGSVQRWIDWMTEPMVLLALAIVLPGVVLFYCGPTWRARVARVAQFALVLAALVGLCWVVYALVRGKFDKEVAQVLARSGRAVTPAALAMAKSEVERLMWHSIFMPRYMGFVWIAFAIAACALLMRLPTRGLRLAAVGLLLAVNLAQFRARLFAGTEPPLEQVAKEVWRHDSHNPQADLTGRVYVNDSLVAGPGHPGYGTLSGQQGKYYLGLARGTWLHPAEWKQVSSSQHFDLHGSRMSRGSRGQRFPLDYASIARDVRQSAGVKRVIVWEKYFDGKPPAADPLVPLLGSGWGRVGEPQDHRVRFHWSWSDLYLYRRTEYVKQ
jgi:4-amino-4-deoxy-L-arabinose transferase-like glycosyltransferase